MRKPRNSPERNLILTGWLTCMVMCQIALCGFLAGSIRSGKFDFLFFVAVAWAVFFACGIAVIAGVQARVVLPRMFSQKTDMK